MFGDFLCLLNRIGYGQKLQDIVPHTQKLEGSAQMEAYQQRCSECRVSLLRWGPPTRAEATCTFVYYIGAPCVGGLFRVGFIHAKASKDDNTGHLIYMHHKCWTIYGVPRV